MRRGVVGVVSEVLGYLGVGEICVLASPYTVGKVLLFCRSGGKEMFSG